MPLEINCPGCGQKLRIGDDLLGKRVACPTCKAIFDAKVEPKADIQAITAQAPAKPEPKADIEAITTQAPAKPEPKADVEHITAQAPAKPEPKTDVEGITAQAPAPPPASERVEEHYEVVDDKVEGQHYAVVDEDPEVQPADPADDRPRRRRPRRPRRSDVRAMVSYPASALKIVAYAGVGLTIITQLLRVGLIMASPEAKDHGGAFMVGSVCGLVITVGLLCLWAKILIYTSDCMYGLDNYGTAIAGCIAAVVLPCGCGWLGAVPVGIWGLVVLCLPSVRDAFLYEDAPTLSYANTSTRRTRRGNS
jgi:hypothetical protein